MIKKIKNKFRLNAKSKILVLGLILVAIIGIGLFSPTEKVNAQAATDSVCRYHRDAQHNEGDPVVPVIDQTACGLNTTYYWGTTTTTTAAPILSTAVGTPSTSTPSPDQTPFEKELGKFQCIDIMHGTIEGCAVKVFSIIFFSIPAGLLSLSAYFFNALLALSLSALLSGSAFLSSAWEVVRDLSNIFFILILLYVAIKIILDLGGHDSKKIIVRVIILALLINFSMFFTKVVIDSANIVALVFYNKLDVNTTVSINGQGAEQRPYLPASSLGDGEKDVSGGMAQAFDASKLISQEFFDKVKAKETVVSTKLGTTLKVGAAIIVPAYGAKLVYDYYFVPQETIPIPTMLLLILITGAIMISAAYCFFIAGFAFLGRALELWVLIIFSPFAFMSFSIPLLEKVEYIGWNAWLKRLLTVSFMAPIFMFFIYFIFLLLKTNIFSGLIAPEKNQTVMAMILGILLPAMFILILLYKATDFAKKGSGKLGEVLTKAAGTVGGLATGLALGAATGGAAVLGRATLGRAGAYLADTKLAQRWESHGFGGEYARRGLAAIGSSSLDIRGAKIGGKTLASATGLKMGEAQKGGFTARREADVKKRQERAKNLEVKEDQPLKQELNTLQREQQELLRASSHELEQLDNQIKGAIDASNAAAAALRAETPGTATHTAAQTTARNAAANVINLRKQKKDIKDATGADVSLLAMEATAARAAAAAAPGDVKLANATRAAEAAEAVARISAAGSGRSINELGDTYIPEAIRRVETENRRIRGVYANTTESGLGRVKNFFLTGGQSSYKGSREAAHKIRMETKIEDKGGGH